MAIEDRSLKPGTTLVAKYKGKEHTAEVIAAKEGTVRYRLADGREFASPSAAGKAVMRGIACNGWRFWSVAGADANAPAGSEASPSRPTSPDGARPAPGGPTVPAAAKSVNSGATARPTAKPAGTAKGKTPKAAREPAKGAAAARKR